MSAQPQNADPAEIGKFDALASRFWDPKGEWWPLHALNPTRLAYVARSQPLAGARVLDVGCGGGLLAEALARAGAHTTGIDLSPALLKTAELHALESGLDITYLQTSAEEHALTHAGSYDVVTCMEMLEHVPDPASVIQALATLVRPGGTVVVSTLNRTPRAFLTAIVGAEYLARVLPKGTHEYSRFLRPSEIGKAARVAGLSVADVAGLTMNPLTREFSLSADVGVNYLMRLTRPT
jgi:2-polyprenyl-6-hydroxyphenyl methylase/3-demethylubiquinone-9 3-methyltransferase